MGSNHEEQDMLIMRLFYRNLTGPLKCAGIRGLIVTQEQIGRVRVSERERAGQTKMGRMVKVFSVDIERNADFALGEPEDEEDSVH